MARILLCGIAVTDFVFKVETMPAEPRKYFTYEAAITGGGCAANAAVAICRLGGEALLSARLGDDGVGDMIAAMLEKEGVDLSLCDRAPDGRSSFSSVYVDATGERQIMNFRGSGLADTPSALSDVPPVDAVLVDNRWGPLMRAGIEVGQRLGVPVIVDGEAQIGEDRFEGASHVAFSRHGLEEFSGPGSVEEMLTRASKELGCWVCVTDGAAGTWICSGGQIEHIAAFAVKAVDTLGAGDIWHGAFALRLAEGADERDAVRFANAAAAIKCTRFGGRDGAPNRGETDLLLENGAL
ncbi:MAG: PfkB family carbohydrate kinase [Ahrensia sp.]|nr:PfkB family carbohydrate kinase [Ahrensia sp.]